MPTSYRILTQPGCRPLSGLCRRAGRASAADHGWNLAAISCCDIRGRTELGARSRRRSPGESGSRAYGRRHPEVAGGYRGRPMHGRLTTTGSTLVACAAPVEFRRAWHATDDGHQQLGGRGAGRRGGSAASIFAAQPATQPSISTASVQLLAPFPWVAIPCRWSRRGLPAMLNNSWGCPATPRRVTRPRSSRPLMRCARGRHLRRRVGGQFRPSAAPSRIPSPSTDSAFHRRRRRRGCGNLAPFSRKGPVTADGSGRTSPAS